MIHEKPSVTPTAFNIPPIRLYLPHMASILRRVPLLMPLLLAAVFAVALPATVSAQAAPGCNCQGQDGSPKEDFMACVENETVCRFACGCDENISCACSCSGSCTLGGQDAGVVDKSASQARSYTLENPLRFDSVEGVIGGIITIFTGVAGSIALLMFTYGGFMMLTSGGNEERVSTGKKALVWATVGLAVIFFSYAFLRFVFTSLGTGV